MSPGVGDMGNQHTPEKLPARPRTGCPMSPGVGDMGNQHTPEKLPARPRTEGAPCLPVLETWETNAPKNCRHHHEPRVPHVSRCWRHGKPTRPKKIAGPTVSGFGNVQT